MVCKLITCVYGSWQTRGVDNTPEINKALLAVISMYPSAATLQYGSQLITVARNVVTLHQMHFLSADMVYGKTCTAAACLLANLAIFQDRL